jgi:hypothetical protein
LRLYHRTNFNLLRYFVFLILPLTFWGCSAPQVTQGLITVIISADNNELRVKITSGSTVQEALKTAQISLNDLDRVEPSLFTILSEESLVRVIRVKEEFYTKQVVIPFEHQELRNEALLEGDSRLSQPGINGLEEITYRRAFEDGIEVSDTQVKSVIIKDAIPEVVMVGSRSTFTPFKIPGKIAYLSAGNAWVIETSTDNRRCVVPTGDLDGRIFSLSKNGDFLLFTRISNVEKTVNSLWVASLKSNPAQLIDLKVENVVHFAEFDPGSSVVAYSTAEWRETSPGWHANNDLYDVTVGESGLVSSPKLDIGANTGGVYGWWGNNYSWAPDQFRFLYSRPDGIGIIDNRNGTLKPILNITPYQTGGNWAWVSEAAWSPDGNVVYAVNHNSTEDNRATVSQEFDLIAIPLTGGTLVVLAKNTGMFAYPEASPMDQNINFIDNASGNTLVQKTFSVAYLQAIFPDQSDTSEYKLFIIDRDGSNKRSLFPEEGAIGLNPQRVVWSPSKAGISGDYAIALIYNGNIWIVNVATGVAQQITGDGLTSRIDWR